MTSSGYEYLCSAGEMFDSIALELYGDEKYACDLINANPKYAQKIVFDGTERLTIPLIEEDAETSASSAAPWKE